MRVATSLKVLMSRDPPSQMQGYIPRSEYCITGIQRVYFAEDSSKLGTNLIIRRIYPHHEVQLNHLWLARTVG